MKLTIFMFSLTSPWYQYLSSKIDKFSELDERKMKKTMIMIYDQRRIVSATLNLIKKLTGHAASASEAYEKKNQICFYRRIL